MTHGPPTTPRTSSPTWGGYTSRRSCAATSRRGDRRACRRRPAGLARRPRARPCAGARPMVQDASFDRRVLEPRVGAQALRGGGGHRGRWSVRHLERPNARRPEILVTLGSHGEEVWVDGVATHVPTTPVLGVETTGAGDAFMVAYVSARRDGASPVEAARRQRSRRRHARGAQARLVTMPPVVLVETQLGIATVDVEAGELLKLEPGPPLARPAVEGINLPLLVAADRTARPSLRSSTGVRRSSSRTTAASPGAKREGGSAGGRRRDLARPSRPDRLCDGRAAARLARRRPLLDRVSGRAALHHGGGVPG